MEGAWHSGGASTFIMTAVGRFVLSPCALNRALSQLSGSRGFLFFEARMEPVIPLHFKHHPLQDKISEIFEQYWHGIRTRENYDHPILDY